MRKETHSGKTVLAVVCTVAEQAVVDQAVEHTVLWPVVEQAVVDQAVEHTVLWTVTATAVKK